MKSKPLVVVTDHLVEAGVETPHLQDVAELRLLQTNDEADVVKHAAQADVVLLYHTMKISEVTLAAMPRVKAVVRCGVGYDNVDCEAAGRRGIVVCNVPDYGTEEVADHALMMLLAIARRLVPAHRTIREGGWDLSVAFGAPRLRGRTLGVVGCGRIGTAMVLRAKAVGMRVVFCDPYLPDGVEKALGVERAVSLEELLPQAEFLTLHCPLTKETRHVLNRRTLSMLPRGAYVINTARGPCVDLPALHEALESGQVQAAGLDVFEREPLDHEQIRKHPRVLLTPHAAFYCVEGFLEMREKGALEARRVLLGEPVRNPVNLQYLQSPRAVVSSPR